MAVAERAGDTPRDRTGETARLLYRIYIALTVAEALLLRIAGLPLFDAITTALTTISTGGFSIRDASIAYYQSHLVNWILIFFMFAASVNFTLLYLCVTRRFREALKSEELRVYSLVVVGASAMIARASSLILRSASMVKCSPSFEAVMLGWIRCPFRQAAGAARR